MVVGSVETAATGAVTRQGDATGQGGRDREPAYSILSARRISIYILKRRRGLSLYSTVDAAVCRAVGGDLVAAIPQRAPGAPELGGVMRHHSIMTQQNECRCSVAYRCPQPYLDRLQVRLHHTKTSPRTRTRTTPLDRMESIGS